VYMYRDFCSLVLIIPKQFIHAARIYSTSPSRRRRTTAFARLIGKRLWQGSLNATAKSTSLLCLLYLQLYQHLHPPSTPPLADSESLYEPRPRRGDRQTKKLADNSQIAKEVATAKGSRGGRARDSQGASQGRRHWRQQRRCHNCWMAPCFTQQCCTIK